MPTVYLTIILLGQGMAIDVIPYANIQACRVAQAKIEKAKQPMARSVIITTCSSNGVDL